MLSPPNFTQSQPERGIFSQVCLVCREKTDRKSTRLNSSHLGISYAVFCLKKKKKKQINKNSKHNTISTETNLHLINTHTLTHDIIRLSSLITTYEQRSYTRRSDTIETTIT